MDSNDIEKIMALSKILNYSKTEPKLIKAENKSLVPENRLNRQIKTLNNIMPYLTGDMKRQIYAVIKIMEIAGFNTENRAIEAEESNNTVFDEKKFAEAAQADLSPNEKQLFNTLYVLSTLGRSGMFNGR